MLSLVLSSLLVRHLQMAGAVRQPIDQAALERYIEKNVPDIKPPLELKQVKPSVLIEVYNVQ